MSRALSLARAIGSDGVLNVGDVAGLAAVASSGSASDLTTGTLPNARLASGAAVANLGYTPVNKAGDTMTGTLAVPRMNINGAPDGEFAENNGRYSSRHATFPSYLFKDGSGGTRGEIYFGIGGSDLTLVNYQSNGSVRLVANGIEAIKTDSSGRVTMPSQPVFYASGLTTGAFSDGALLNFSGASLNRGNCFNGSNSRFTAPVGGVYVICVGIYVYNESGKSLQSYALRVNGSQVALSGDNTIFYSTAGVSGDNMVMATLPISLNAGDYLTINMRSGAPAVNVYSGHSWFAGYLLG